MCRGPWGATAVAITFTIYKLFLLIGQSKIELRLVVPKAQRLRAPDIQFTRKG